MTSPVHRRLRHSASSVIRRTHNLPRTAGTPLLLRRPFRRLARLVDAPPSSVHGVASFLRRVRRLSRAPMSAHRDSLPPCWRSSWRSASPRMLSTNCTAVRWARTSRRSILVTSTVLSLAGAVALGAVGVWKVGWALDSLHGARSRSRRRLQPGAVRWPDPHRRVVCGRLGFVPGPCRVRRANWEASTRPQSSPRLLRFFVSAAQRQLSTPARLIRRRSATVEGSISLRDGSTLVIDKRSLLLAPRAGPSQPFLGHGLPGHGVCDRPAGVTPLRQSPPPAVFGTPPPWSPRPYRDPTGGGGDRNGSRVRMGRCIISTVQATSTEEPTPERRSSSLASPSRSPPTAATIRR